MERHIQNIFPTAVGVIKNFLSEDQRKEVLDLCKSLEYKPIDYDDDTKSQISLDRSVLDYVPVIKTLMYQDFLQYVQYIMNIVDADFRIGTSWTTKAPHKTQSDWHIHSNYFFSGVYYPEDSSPIIFKNQLVDHYVFEFSGNTPYNSNTYTHHPEKNSLVFFRSNLFHKISKNTSENDRYSLAFNIMPVGIYGTGDGEITVK